jgi:tetratricopeptide (TPR) repeat protein
MIGEESTLAIRVTRRSATTRQARQILLVAVAALSPCIAMPRTSVESSWNSLGCGKTKAIGNVASSRLAENLADIERVQAAAESLLPNTGLVRPAFTLLLKCGSGDVPEAIFTARGFFTFLVVPCRSGTSNVPAVEGLVRHALERSFEHPPLWLSVGLARYVRVLADGTRSGLGAPLADDLVALRGPWLPVGTVLSATSESAAWQDASLRRRFAAQAGLYVAYWAAQHPKGDLGHFMTERSVVGPEAVLKNGLGEDLDEFGSSAERYFREGAFRQTPLERSARSGEVGCPGVMPAAEATALWIHAMADQRRLLEAKALAEDAIARFPSANQVRAARARVLAELGSRNEALDEFRRLKRSGGLSDADRYFFAEALLGAPKTSPSALPEELVEAEQILGGGETDLPADVYGLRGTAALARGDATEAALNALEAFARWPRHEFALLAARAYLRQGNTAAAFATLRDLEHGGETSQVRDAAAVLLKDIPPDGRQSARGMPVLRRPAAGELTLTGRLITIDCGEFWTILTVHAGPSQSRYAITRLAFLDIRSYGTVSATSVTCGARARPEMVRLTWRHETTTPKEAEGIASALEFLP